MQSKLRVGTRKSDLALAQTTQVIHTLQSKGLASEAKHIVTTGDRDLRPFQNMIGDGFFTKEIEKNLLTNEIDLAVHSSKDLPSQIHRDLPWVAFSEREDTNDIMIIRKDSILSISPIHLKKGITVGTSSPRREAQLRNKFPGINVISIRGNVPTRVEKVASGEVQATVLAKAGVNRLNLKQSILDKNLVIIDLDFVTAPCQGIIGVQANIRHQNALDIIQNKDLTEIALAEKCILSMLGGGCHLAVGSKITKKENSKYQLDFFFNETEAGKEKITEFVIEADSLEKLLRDLFKKLTATEKFGERVISTQALQHQLRIAKKLVKNKFIPVPWVTREILPIFSHEDFKEVRSSFSTYDALVFSSQFSVRIFMNEFISQNPDLLETMKSIKVYSVGESTKKSLNEYGIEKVIVPNEAHGQALLDLIDAKNPLLMGSDESLLYKLSQKQGRNYKYLKLYASFVCQNPLSRLPTLRDNDRLVLTNPLCAMDFVEIYKSNPSQFKQLKIFAFGPSTSKILTENNITHTVNRKSGSWDEMIETLKTN